MKERIVINNNQHLPRASYYVAKDGHYDVGAVNYATPETILNENRIVAVKEQVPENFADLLTLCKNLKEKLNKEIWEITIEDDFIYVRKKWETKEICFTSVGNMVSNNGWDLLMTNLTPARQWDIIKNLVGEE